MDNQALNQNGKADGSASPGNKGEAVSIVGEPLPADKPAGPSSGAAMGAEGSGIQRGREEREKVGKATFAITFFLMAGRLMGFVEALLVGSLAGGGNVAGAYFSAVKIPWSIVGFGDQLLTHSFLPPFVEAREKRGKDEAWRLASLVGTIQFIILIAVVGFALIFTPDIVRMYNRNFPAQTLALTTTLARIMLPAAIMMSLASLTYVLLNAHKQFGLPACGDTALKFGIVIVGAAGYHYLGIKGFAAGLILGAFIKLSIHLFGLRQYLPRMRWNLDIHQPAARKLLVLMVPLMISNVLSFIRPYIDNYLSGRPSEVAALSFAFKLTNLPFLLVPYALGIALFPFLAEMATRGDRKQLGRALVSSIRMVTFLLLPIMITYIVLALPMVEAVFKHGKFSIADAVRVSQPLIWYAVALLPLAFETIILQIFFAMSDTTTPTIVAYATFILYLGVGFATADWMGWGAAGVALAFLTYKAGKDVILLGILSRRLHGIDLAGVGKFILKLAVAGVAMAMVLLAVTHATHTASAPAPTSAARAAISTPAPAPSSLQPNTTRQPAAASSTNKKAGKLKALKVFVILATPGIAVFVLLAYLLGIEELFTLYAVLVRRLGPVLSRVVALLESRW